MGMYDDPLVTYDGLPTDAFLNNMPTAAEIAAAILAAAQITPIHADTRKVNGTIVDGSGTTLDPWGPV